MERMEQLFGKYTDKILTKVDGWIEEIVALTPNMLISILLLILFFLLAKLASGTTKKVFQKTSDNKALRDLFAVLVRYTIMAIGIFTILEVLNLGKAVTSLLAGVGIVGLALGFAFQDIAANFVSGIILAVRRPISIGDIISTSDVMGKVVRLNLRVTVIQTFQGQEVFIPNKEVLQSPIYNYTNTGKRRIDLQVGISYAEDLPFVEQLVKDTVHSIDGVIDHDNTVFDYYEYGSSSINFHIRFWIEYPGEQKSFLGLRHEAIKNIKAAFDQNGITIPFPIRTLDFGIKGGQKLSEMSFGSKS
jgi:small conductance mechanosensitive channel